MANKKNPEAEIKKVQEEMEMLKKHRKPCLDKVALDIIATVNEKGKKLTVVNQNELPVVVSNSSIKINASEDKKQKGTDKSDGLGKE